MTVKEASEQQSPVKRQNNFFSFCFFKGTVLFSLLPVSVSGYGAVPAAGPVTGLLLSVQLQLLTRVLALPQTRSLQDLLHQLLEGTLDAIFGLCTGLCAKGETGWQERWEQRFKNMTSVVLNDITQNEPSLLVKSVSFVVLTDRTLFKAS